MGVFDWAISNWLSLVGIVLAVAALTLQLLDKPRLRISDINVSFGGSRTTQGTWQYGITCINVIVENRGGRPAIGCEGVVILAGMEGLPLRPQTRDYVLNMREKHFDIQPKGKAVLVAAWHVTTDGMIDGSQQSIDPSTFLEKGLPLSAVISLGGKRVRRSYQKEEFRSKFEEHQIQSNVYEVR